jgi:hypothetical protein
VCLGLGVAIAGFPHRNRDRPVRVTAVLTTTTTVAPAETIATAAPDPTVVAAQREPRPPGDINVRFYNGSTLAGAAVKVGDELAKRGYGIAKPGPSPADPLPATRIWYLDGWDVEAASVADALGISRSSIAVWTPDAPVKVDASAAVAVLVADDVVRRPMS